MTYEQFDLQPGKSVSLLNNDPEWNSFVSFDSDNDEEINAYFKRDEFEKYVLDTAYFKGYIGFRTIEESNGFKFSLQVIEITTTYNSWAEKNEPIIKIEAMIISPEPIVGHNHCAFEFSYLVRAPFAGRFDSISFYQERENNGGQLFKLYTPNRTKELWPHFEQMEWIYDNPNNLYHVDIKFNEYKYDENFWDGIPYYDFEAYGQPPCLRYEWKVPNFSNVVKDQHVCSIVKNPYRVDRKEYKIYSPATGIITFGINGEITEYTCQEKMNDSSDLFSIYKNRLALSRFHYISLDREERDEFDGTISLFWDSVAGRRLPKSENDDFSFMDGFPGFEMKADADKYIIVSLELQKNTPYIVFSVNSKKIRLTNGDYIDMQFKGINGDKTFLSFPITSKGVEKEVGSLFDISFYCELSQSDIDCMMYNDCVSWRIRFNKQPYMSIIGRNESTWCPEEYARDVFKAYAKQFMEIVKDLQDEYPIVFASLKNNKASVTADESCYVYLMYDSTNSYYKIGISNNPEYRERTLQSEKPTIERICAKEFPNRAIASAIESALHKTFESKRLRGEWFALDDNDVNAIIATLS